MDWDDISTPDPSDGADLFCFPSTTSPAVRISGTGLANWSSYGVRTIAADDVRGELYLGMANVQNLLTSAGDDLPEGGWEVQRVTLRYGDEDFDGLEDAWETSVFGSTGFTDDPWANTDGDLLSDYGEWLTGSDPQDAGSFFRTAFGAAGAPRRIEWDSLAGRYYTVYEAEAPGGDWDPVAVYPGTGAPLFHLFDPAAQPQRYFKVEAGLDLPEP
jgi:hypothetical protein